LLMLAACEPEPKGPVQIEQPESMRFETEHIRREVDLYKTNPSAIGKRRMEKAFAAFDAQIGELETLAQTQGGSERQRTERQIADMKQRRELHWTRAQTAYVETMPVKRAEAVGERTKRSEQGRRSKRARRNSEESATAERIIKAEPVPRDR